jgi:hypothetical protein
MPDSEFGELARPTTNTSRDVINGAKAGLDGAVLLIDLLIPGERISWGSAIPLLTLCAPLKLGVSNASLADFAATLTSRLPVKPPLGVMVIVEVPVAPGEAMFTAVLISV